MDKITKLVDVVADGNFPNQARPHEDLDKDLQDSHIDQNGGKIPFKKKRTEVKKAASYDKDLGVRVSLQICPVTEIRTRLNGMLQLIKCFQTKSCNINGMMNVLDELMVTSIEVFSSIRVNFPIKGLIEHSAAYQLYCSAFTHTPNVDHFKDELLSRDFGLPVVLFPWNGKVYVVLKSEILGIPFIISSLLSSANEYQMENSDKKNQLSKKTVQQFIKSMDSEYDKKVVKACFAMLLSRTELEKVGIKTYIATRHCKK